MMGAMTTTTAARRLYPGESIEGALNAELVRDSAEGPLRVIGSHVLMAAEHLGVEPVGKLTGSYDIVSNALYWKLTGMAEVTRLRPVADGETPDPPCCPAAALLARLRDDVHTAATELDTKDPGAREVGRWLRVRAQQAAITTRSQP